MSFQLELDLECVTEPNTNNVIKIGLQITRPRLMRY
jgi:hypothetical protein